MDEAAIYDARLELVDFAVGALGDAPAESFVEGLLADGVQVPADEVYPALDEGFAHLERFVEANGDRPLDAVVDDLRAEYSRVFVGPRPPVVAHETYYREDTEFIGEGLADVQAGYAAAGWSSPDDYPEEDDFVAVELAFLRHLIERQREGDEAAVDLERTFLDEHLGVWIDDFAADVAEATDEPLYLAAARIAQGLVDFETEVVVQAGGGR